MPFSNTSYIDVLFLYFFDFFSILLFHIFLLPILLASKWPLISFLITFPSLDVSFFFRFNHLSAAKRLCMIFVHVFVESPSQSQLINHFFSTEWCEQKFSLIDDKSIFIIIYKCAHKFYVEFSSQYFFLL